MERMGEENTCSGRFFCLISLSEKVSECVKHVFILILIALKGAFDKTCLPSRTIRNGWGENFLLHDNI